MVDKEILKKYNLKAVPFSCIGEGETYIDEVALEMPTVHDKCHFRCSVVDEAVIWHDGAPSDLPIPEPSDTVYVPVWRPCN